MARKIVQELNYTFNAATRTITIPRYVPQERMILITNVTSNTVIYNFSDNTLRATSYTATGGQAFPQNTQSSLGSGLTTIVLNFNTSGASMANGDKLQFLIDDFEERFIPAETYVDPANKMRVSTPQALIDTDFELGLQTTKWEFFQSNNGAQSVYTRPTDAPLQPVYGGMGYALQNYPATTTGGNSTVISSLSLARAPAVGSYVYIVDNNYAAFRYTITVSSTTSITVSGSATNGAPNTVQLIIIADLPGTVTNPSYAAFSVTNDIAGGTSAIVAGTPVLIQDTFDETSADGTFTAAYVSTVAKSFGFIPKSNTANYNILNRPNTVAYVGAYYGAYAAGSAIPWTSVVADGSRTVTVNTITPHGQTVGTPIFIGNTTQTNANGPWYILSVPTPTSFTYATLATVTAGTISTTTSLPSTTTQVYLRPEGNQTHRPQDGGVQITPGNNVVGAQAVRQTRRYFRYQSGKGIQFSTAFTFKPNYDIVGLTVSGNIATITCDQDHGLKPGAIVRFTGLTAINTTDQNLYNNTFVVLASQPITSKQFAVQLAGTPTDTNPGGSGPTVECAEAKGYAARAGLFDDQNGMFWEFDGSTLNVVRRNATSVLRGSLINVCTGSTLVTGDLRSKFTKQCFAGDRVVIRGMTYTVTRVISDTEMNISPAYRAATQSTAQGTSGLPYATLTAASSQLQTINIQASTTLSQVTSAASSGGASGSFVMTNTFTRILQATANAGSGTIGVSGSRTFTITAYSSSIVPGMLVIGPNIPANTYVDASYVAASPNTTIPLTQALTGAVSTTANAYEFFLVPASGVNVTGSNLGTNTQVSSIVFTTTGGATTSGTVGLTQAMTGTATGTYTYGLVTAGVATSVITLANTYGISPGMSISGTNIPGNCLVAYVQPQGSAIVLNQAITVAAGIGNGTSLTFNTLHSLQANTQTNSAIMATSTNQMVMTSLSGISIGNFLTTATPGQYFSIGTYVTNINTTTNTITLSANPVLQVPATTTITFSSRIFVTATNQTNLNGQWPIYQISGTAITFHTAAAATATGTVSTFGITKVFGEDLVGRKGLVRELRIPQTNWNLDTMDGRGPSGFNLDPTKVQMIYMDYTWYGAGFARWGLRTANGDIAYCHKLQHGNTQYQAYLRSGNLPGRFELNNVGAVSNITANITSTGYTITPSSPGTINVFDATKYFVPFTDTASGTGKNGEVVIDGEFFYYTGLGSTTGQAPWATGDNGVTSVATLGAVTISGGVITAIAVTNGGAGYTAPPPIVISGPGAQARAVANIVNGSVTSITITNGGTGYTSTPTVYIGPNQLTGAVREPNAVSVGALVGATSVSGSTGITGVTNAASYYIGMKLAANAAFNNQPVTITGILGNVVYVDSQAVTSGSITIAPIQKGVNAAIHYANNNTGLPVSVALSTVQQLTPAAQHWGVSCMMDGRFDNDKSYVFTTPRQTASVVQQNTTAPLISIRVSPSVSLGFARNFGVRDIINRMQLNLYQMDVYTSGQFLITVRYNCSSNVFVPALWTANLVGSGSLSQVIYHNPSDVVTGGDVVLAYYATNAGSGVFAVTQQDMTIVKDLGNSIVGGDSVYPDGPDVITVFATNLSTSTSSPIYARLSWNEAQA